VIVRGHAWTGSHEQRAVETPYVDRQGPRVCARPVVEKAAKLPGMRFIERWKLKDFFLANQARQFVFQVHTHLLLTGSPQASVLSITTEWAQHWVS
jgi:hypothetical protein